jgi:hypothetical protein
MRKFPFERYLFIFLGTSLTFLGFCSEFINIPIAYAGFILLITGFLFCD